MPDEKRLRGEERESKEQDDVVMADAFEDAREIEKEDKLVEREKELDNEKATEKRKHNGEDKVTDVNRLTDEIELAEEQQGPRFPLLPSAIVHLI